jgi:signal transduction histidine kinase
MPEDSDPKPKGHPATFPPIGPVVLVLLAAMAVTGGVCAWVVAATPAEAQAPVAVGCVITAILLSVAVTVAAYGVQAALRFRGRIQALHSDAARLADEALSDVVRRIRDGASVDTSLAAVPQPNFPAHQDLLRALAAEIAQSERMRAAATTTYANAAGRVQAMTTSMLADLREMEHRHGEEVLGDLLKLDHNTAQVGRLADSIAVLTGARSGRRWSKPIVMESVLRGAVGRINAYQRVRLHSTSTVAIAGFAAEGVMHTLAELMDNAASFSPPSEEVHVYVEEVHAGVVVTVEDGGLVMSDQALQRAERAVSPEPLDLTTLSGSRLGLAVVGCLARKHGMTVSFRPSSRGGTGVVVLIPREVITEPRDETPRAATVSTDDTDESTVDDLPKRPRGQTLSAATASTASSAATSRVLPDAGTRFGAFRRASTGHNATEGQS